MRSHMHQAFTQHQSVGTGANCNINQTQHIHLITPPPPAHLSLFPSSVQCTPTGITSLVCRSRVARLRVPAGCTTELNHLGHQFLQRLFDKYDEVSDRCRQSTRHGDVTLLAHHVTNGAEARGIVQVRWLQ